MVILAFLLPKLIMTTSLGQLVNNDALSSTRAGFRLEEMRKTETQKFGGSSRLSILYHLSSIQAVQNLPPLSPQSVKNAIDQCKSKRRLSISDGEAEKIGQTSSQRRTRSLSDDGVQKMRSSAVMAKAEVEVEMPTKTPTSKAEKTRTPSATNSTTPTTMALAPTQSPRRKLRKSYSAGIESMSNYHVTERLYELSDISEDVQAPPSPLLPSSRPSLSPSLRHNHSSGRFAHASADSNGDVAEEDCVPPSIDSPPLNRIVEKDENENENEEENENENENEEEAPSRASRCFSFFHFHCSDFLTCVFLLLNSWQILNDLSPYDSDTGKFDMEYDQQFLRISDRVSLVFEFLLLSLFMLELSFCLTQLHRAEANPKLFFVGVLDFIITIPTFVLKCFQVSAMRDENQLLSLKLLFYSYIFALRVFRRYFGKLLYYRFKSADGKQRLAETNQNTFINQRESTFHTKIMVEKREENAVVIDIWRQACLHNPNSGIFDRKILLAMLGVSEDASGGRRRSVENTNPQSFLLPSRRHHFKARRRISGAGFITAYEDVYLAVDLAMKRVEYIFVKPTKRPEPPQELQPFDSDVLETNDDNSLVVINFDHITSVEIHQNEVCVYQKTLLTTILLEDEEAAKKFVDVVSIECPLVIG